MPVHLPSLNALRAFEAAGRHLSFSKAAEELHVTPAAVGHQVKALEHDLGALLFDRLNRALQLTSAGQTLLPGLSEVFYRLTEVVETFRRRDANRPLTVSMPPSFGAAWLVPRLERFRDRHPDIDVRLDVDNRIVDLLHDDVDVGLRYGLGDYPGMRVDCLLSEEVFPVCSARLMEGEHPLRAMQLNDSLDSVLLMDTDELFFDYAKHFRLADHFRHAVAIVPEHIPLLLGPGVGSLTAGTEAANASKSLKM